MSRRPDLDQASLDGSGEGIPLRNLIATACCAGCLDPLACAEAGCLGSAAIFPAVSDPRRDPAYPFEGETL